MFLDNNSTNGLNSKLSSIDSTTYSPSSQYVFKPYGLVSWVIGVLVINLYLSSIISNAQQLEAFIADVKSLSFVVEVGRSRN